MGITIGPSRVYYTIGPGQSQTEKVRITNPSKDYTLELGISFEDWHYSAQGDNVLYDPGTLPSSCAAWVNAPAFFSLGPEETKEIDVQLSIPAGYSNDTVPVHTAMLYVTQLNPRESVDKDGANIRIAVRTGIKLYQRLPGAYKPELDITGFGYETAQEGPSALVLSFANTGNVWADGAMKLELLNQATGAKTVIPDVAFFSMPGDRREQYIALPDDLEPASYIATALVNYGDANALKIAELEFNHGRNGN